MTGTAAASREFFIHLSHPKPNIMYYSGQEIVEIAVRIEENGNEFYTAAADMIPESNDIKGLFYDLAEKEILHISIFQKLAEKFDAETFDFSAGDASDYINHLAESHIFGKPDSGKTLALALKTPREGLEAAFKFENDSVAFYTELLKYTRSDSKKLVQQIIDEEKEHAAEIRRFL
jgi:rubrerythrin